MTFQWPFLSLSNESEGMRVTRKGPTTIAMLGGNTVAGLALSFLLRGVGYEMIIVKARPTGPAQDPFREVDLLLVSPDLDEGRRKESSPSSETPQRGCTPLSSPSVLP